MSALLSGIIGAIKGASITAKIITVTATVLVVGGGATTAVILTNNNDQKTETVQAETNDNDNDNDDDNAPTDESETVDTSDEATESTDGEDTTTTPTNTNSSSNSSNSNSSTVPTKKTQYRYRDKEAKTSEVVCREGESCYTQYCLGYCGDSGRTPAEEYAKTKVPAGCTWIRVVGAGADIDNWAVGFEYSCWGVWSGWQDGAVSGNTNREVETREV